MMCMHCAGKAVRIGEGIEDDLYQGGECGRKFGIAWKRGEPQKPCSPPTAEDIAEAKRLVALMAARRQPKP